MKSNRRYTLAQIPDTMDLASTCYSSRVNLALELYEIVLEKLYRAAKEGKNHLIIKELTMVSEIEKVGEVLAFQLFKHNIYRLVVTRNECTIYLTKNAFTWRRNFENTDWEDPAEETGTTDSRTPTPPPPSQTAPLRRQRAILSPLVSPARQSNRGRY